MRNFVPVVLAVPLLLAACASPGQQAAERQARLARYVGMSEQALIAELGPPRQRQVRGDHESLAWVSDYSQWVAGSPFDPNPPELLGLQYHAIPPVHMVWYCETSFDIVAGKVSAARQRGNYCGGSA